MTHAKYPNPRYEWLRLLHIELDKATNLDDLETLAARARMPVGVVEDILDGRYVPERLTIEQLVAEMTTSVEHRAIVLETYDQEIDQNLLEELNDPSPLMTPSPDAKLIAGAISEVALAIREGLQAIAIALQERR